MPKTTNFVLCTSTPSSLFLVLRSFYYRSSILLHTEHTVHIVTHALPCLVLCWCPEQRLERERRCVGNALWCRKRTDRRWYDDRYIYSGGEQYMYIQGLYICILYLVCYKNIKFPDFLMYNTRATVDAVSPLESRKIPKMKCGFQQGVTATLLVVPGTASADNY